MVAIGVAAVPIGFTPAVAVAVVVMAVVVVQPPNRGSGGKDGSHARGFGRYTGAGSA